MDCLAVMQYQEKNPTLRNGRYVADNFPRVHGELSEVLIPRTVKMHDARPVLAAGGVGVDSTGFTLVKHDLQGMRDSSKEMFLNDERVKKDYYIEVEKIVQKATGASRVLVFDHNVRSSAEKDRTNTEGAGGFGRPLPRVHCDYTEVSGPTRLRSLAAAKGHGGSYVSKKPLLELAEAERIVEHCRFAFINVWRNIADAAITRSPLAVCDARSTPSKDRFKYEMIYSDRIGENFSLEYAPSHKWFYFSEMQKDEALLFKCYDSDTSVPARFTFHAAFEHPATTSSSPERESIEVRTVAIFDEPKSKL